MATLNEIAYNIKNLMNGGEPDVEDSLDLRQIKHWVHYHRARIIEEKVKKGGAIDSRWVQPILSKSIFYSSSRTHVKINHFSFDNESYYGKDHLNGNEYDYIYERLEIPSTINTVAGSGIMDARFAKRIADSDSKFVGWLKLDVKSKDETSYSSFNRFTKPNQPYITQYSISNTGQIIEIGGLKAYAKKFSKDSKVKYQYTIRIEGILEDPTKGLVYINGLPTTYDDVTSTYPISSEDISKLIERVVQLEGTVVLKTPTDYIEDNRDTDKLPKIGGE